MTYKYTTTNCPAEEQPVPIQSGKHLCHAEVQPVPIHRESISTNDGKRNTLSLGEGRGEASHAEERNINCHAEERSIYHLVALKCHLNPDHYHTLMFEIGAQFLETWCTKYFVNGPEMYADLSQEASFSYWEWWKTTWANDDLNLLNHRWLTPGQPGYEPLKSCLINNPLLEKELYYLIFPLL